MLIILLAAGCRQARTAGRASAASEPSASLPPFQDVTVAAGIDFRLTPAKRPMRILESVGSGGGMCDFDGDGKLDVLVIGVPRCALYRNLGDGRFEDVTARAGLTEEATWIAGGVADYDRDGDVDLLLVGYRKTALMRNNGNGVFEDVTAGSGLDMGARWCNAVAFADFDRDGFADVFIGTYVKFGPNSKQYCRLHENGVLSSCRPLDYDPEQSELFRNRGDGTFEPVGKKWGLSAVNGKNLGAAVGDFNRDGWPDLYLANDEMPQDLLLNEGGKRFRNVGAEAGAAYLGDGRMMGGMGVDWGDIDNDGWLDIIVGTYENEAKALFRNLQGQSFEWATPASQLTGPTYPSVVFGTLFFDFDNDGARDVIFANGHVFDNVAEIKPNSTFRQPTQLFRNRGNGVFDPVHCPVLDEPIVGRGLATGDYDEDGDLDLLVVDADGPVRLLRNNAAAGRNWLSLRLIGTESNPDALGAQVTVTAGGNRYFDEVRTTRGYASFCDGRVHFGLGSTSHVDSIEIRWPSGKVTRRGNVAANQVLEVREPGVKAND